ncbi:MAG: T9SS type A sorting domain-containing protein [Bacteroidota bacterium]
MIVPLDSLKRRGTDGASPTTFQFSGNPTIEGEWSHYDVESFNLWTNNNTIGSTNFGKWKNGDRSTLDIAFSYHREPGRDFLGNVELMYEDLEDLQAFYDNQFEQSCSPSSTLEVSLETVQIYPNPVQNELYVARSELSSIESMKIIDALGRTILQAQHIDEFIPVASLPSGY